MKKSTHRVEVVKLCPEKHPNADSLVIQKVRGYQVCLREADWVGREFAAYIQPDSVVDTDRTEFSWLKGPHFKNALDNDPTNTRFHKVCAMRLRGVLSYGLMVEAPAGSNSGDDVSDILGVTRYSPTVFASGEIAGPDGYAPEYDVESFAWYAGEMFRPGETVLAFEKMDGTNSRFKFEGKIHAGSKTIWLGDHLDYATWWKALKQNTGLELMCRENSGLVPYGEIVGYGGHSTKKRYGVKPGEIDYYMFDILHNDVFLSWREAKTLADKYQVKTVPLVAEMPFDHEKLMALADGPSLITGANHAREGVVIRPVQERRDLAGRVVLKIVSGKSLIG